MSAVPTSIIDKQESSMTIHASAKPEQQQREMQDQISRMERIQANEMADKLMLWEWGKWARKSGLSLGYPACTLHFSAKGSWEKNLHRYIPDIDDETGLIIEEAVTQLMKVSQQHHAVIVAVYKLRIETRRLPQVLQISDREVAAYRNQAIGMLHFMLAGKLKIK